MASSQEIRARYGLDTDEERNRYGTTAPPTAPSAPSGSGNTSIRERYGLGAPVQRQQDDGGDYGLGIFAAFRRGLERSFAMGDVAQGDYEELAGHYQNMKQWQMAPEDAAKFEELRDTEGFWKKAGGLMKNPRLVLQVVAESLPMMAGPIAGAIGGGVAGGAAGSAVPGIGTAAGTITGSMVGGGVGSFFTEYFNAMGDYMQEQGVNPENPAQLKAAFEDEDMMAQAKDFAFDRGIPIAVFDALSMGLAGRIAKPISGVVGKVTGGRRIGAGVASEIGMQAGFGAAGEAGAQLASTGEIGDELDVLLEGFAEIVPGVFEAGVSKYLDGRKLKEKGLLDPEESPLAAMDRAEARELPITEADIDPVTGEPIPRVDDVGEQLGYPADQDQLDIQLEDGLADLKMGLEGEAMSREAELAAQEHELFAQGTRNRQMLELERQRDTQLSRQKRPPVGVDQLSDIAEAETVYETALRNMKEKLAGGGRWTYEGEERVWRAFSPKEVNLLEAAITKTEEKLEQLKVGRDYELSRDARKAQQEETAWADHDVPGIEETPSESEMATPRKLSVDEEPIDVTGGQPTEAMRAGEEINPIGGRPLTGSLGEALLAAGLKPTGPAPPGSGPGGPFGPGGAGSPTKDAATTPPEIAPKPDARDTRAAESLEFEEEDRAEREAIQDEAGPTTVEEDPSYPSIPFEPLAEPLDENASLDALMREVQPGGGVSIVPDQNYQGGESDPRNADGSAEVPTVRTPSTNPPWFQDIVANERVGMAYVENAIKRFKEGKRLGAKQKRVIEAMQAEAAERNLHVTEPMPEGSIISEVRAAATAAPAPAFELEREQDGITPEGAARQRGEGRVYNPEKPEPVDADIGVPGDMFSPGANAQVDLVDESRAIARKEGEVPPGMKLIDTKPSELNALVAEVEAEIEAFIEKGETDGGLAQTSILAGIKKLKLHKHNRANDLMKIAQDAFEGKGMTQSPLDKGKAADEKMDAGETLNEEEADLAEQYRQSEYVKGLRAKGTAEDSLVADIEEQHEAWRQIRIADDEFSWADVLPQDEIDANNIRIDRLAEMGQVDRARDLAKDMDHWLYKDRISGKSNHERFKFSRKANRVGSVSGVRNRGSISFDAGGLSWDVPYDTLTFTTPKDKARLDRILEVGETVPTQGEEVTEDEFGGLSTRNANVMGASEVVNKASKGEEFQAAQSSWYTVEVETNDKGYIEVNLYKQEGVQKVLVETAELAGYQGIADKFINLSVAASDAHINAHELPRVGPAISMLTEDGKFVSVKGDVFPPSKNRVVLDEASKDKLKDDSDPTAWTMRKATSKMVFGTIAKAKSALDGWKAEAKRIGETGANKNKVIISLFDATGTWSQPYVDAGYTVLRYDSARGDDIHSKDWFMEIEAIKEKGYEIVGVMAAPPCTSFSSAGAQWWGAQHDSPSKAWVEKKYGKQAAFFYDKPIEYAEAIMTDVTAIVDLAQPTEFHAMENPSGRLRRMLKDGEWNQDIGLPSLSFDPWHYGDPYTKRTHLWGEMNTDLPQATVVPTEGSKMHKMHSGTETIGGERSATPEGFAYAFFMANHSTPGTTAPVAEPTPQDEIDYQRQSGAEDRAMELEAALEGLGDSLTPQIHRAVPSAAEIEAAAAETNPAPTEGQIEAENYKKGRLKIAGFGIAIENAVGSVRYGNQKMKDVYGHFEKFEGADKDKLDVFVNPKAAEDFTGDVYVVDQYIDGKFDEHKVMLGYNNMLDARRAYKRNYNKNWKGLKNITKMSQEDFGTWAAALKNGTKQEAVQAPLGPESPAFKKWFGDSKVVDKKGKPVMAFHGSQSQEAIEVFDPKGSFGGWNNVGTWFSDQPHHAEIFANTNPYVEMGAETAQIIPAYIKMENPWNTTWDHIQDELDQMIAEHNDANPNDQIDKYGGAERTQMVTSKVGLMFREHLKKLGYDGLMLEKWEGDGLPAQNVYVPFESNQIKSAYGNSGAYDATNKSILYSSGKKLTNAPTDKWLTTVLEGGETKMGDIPDTVPLNIAVSELLNMQSQLKGEPETAAVPTGPTLEEVKTAIQPVEDRMPGAPVTLLNNYKQAPTAVVKTMQAEGMTEVPAVYDPETGAIYMFADKIKTTEDGIRTALHEKTHRGLRQAFGKDLDPLLNDIFANVNETRQADMQEIADNYNLDPGKAQDRLIIAEELLTHMAENDPQSGLVKRAIAFIRKLLRKAGIVQKFTDNDLTALIREAQGAISRQPIDQPTGTMIEEEVVLADTGEVFIIEQDADIMLTGVNKRIEVCKKLRSCL